MRLFSAFLCIVFLAGCATSSTPRPPAVGSSEWHDQRISEIQSAYDLGKIDFNTYVSLKNEADQINVDYRASRRVQPRTSVGFGIGVGHYHHRHRGRPGHR